MTEIQIRLADINRRASDAQAQRDRQFWTLIGFHMLVIVGALMLFVSIPRAQSAFHQQYLAQQESRNG
ncbi:hypothetical protein [Rhizobium ruizarguesonis]|uniref:hypothetical protein n=1 Tax=Rhizobium ruizarguesonis TaxID=2081791 RepID=UPI001031B6CD|nr:hypothetical protein [Rhizobium ruizarguesonis]TBE67464.1 hypothetical protein ELH00_16500 [Rhizobium ruizarguesonis]